MISVNDLRKGMAFRLNGQLYIVTDQTHTKPGKGNAFVQLSYRSISTGSLTKNKFSPSEKMEQVSLETKKVQFLYEDGTNYHFMDLVDYHQFEVPVKSVGEAKNYLAENMEAQVLVHEETILEVVLPASVILTVKESDPGVKGDSATNVQKPATLETGYVVSVPLFIEVGEKVKVDTRTGEYLSRG